MFAGASNLVGIVTLESVAELVERALDAVAIAFGNAITCLGKCLLGAIREGVGCVALLGSSPGGCILLRVLVSLSHHPLDVRLAEVGGCGHLDTLLAASAQILGVNVDDPVCIDV